MKNKKGFTLIELLAVIVVLAIIMVIAVPNIINTINESKAKTRFIAAKEIVEIAEAAYSSSNFPLTVEEMVGEYLEDDVTNPENGGNRTLSNKLDGHNVCMSSSFTAQTGYEPTNGNCYKFDGYAYDIDGDCKCD